MYKELSIHRNDILVKDIQQKILVGIKNNVGGISILSYYLPDILDIVPEGISIAAPIDYPFGVSCTKLRQHATIAALRRGANTIDLIINVADIINDRENKVEQDIMAHVNICKDRATLRLLLEYRFLNRKQLYRVCEIAKELGIEYILPSTGFMVDEYRDNLIVGLDLQKKFNFNVITNGNIWLKKQYGVIRKSGIFGIRLKNFDLKG